MGCLTTRFIPIEKLDKTRKYYIAGFPKCGTKSFSKYMRNRGYDIIDGELDVTNIIVAENYDYYDRTPIIITRNPIERAWSDFHNFHRKTLSEACDWSFYKAGLQMWDALIYSLEYLKKLDGFPHENITDKPDLPIELKYEIIKELNICHCRE